MPENDKIVNLEFPEGGVDLLREFQEQEPGTTARAENVRFLNADSLRSRGGSRPGLARHVPLRIPADVAESLVIQHLNVIVDPQATALGQNFPTPGPDWVEDPQNPGFYLPPGGWGHQPNPDATPNPPPTPGDEIEFVQATASAVDGVPVSYGITPSTGDLLVIAVATEEFYTAPGSPTSDDVTVAVTNGNGDPYTQIGSYIRSGTDFTGATSNAYFALSMWYRVASVAADDTFAVTASASVGSVSGSGAGTHYTGTASVSVLNDSATEVSEAEFSGSPSSLTAGPVSVQEGGLVIAATQTEAGTLDTTDPALTIRNSGVMEYISPIAQSLAVDFEYSQGGNFLIFLAAFNKAP